MEDLIYTELYRLFGNERSRDKIPMALEVQISGDLFKEAYQMEDDHFKDLSTNKAWRL